jgi:hypothetical protein
LYTGINAHYQSAPLPVTVLKSNVNSGVYSIFTPGSTRDFKCIESTGKFTIQYLDTASLSSLFRLHLKDSKVNIDFDGVTDRKISLNSENSLGSRITSNHEGIHIVPDIESTDRPAFERIKDKKKPA